MKKPKSDPPVDDAGLAIDAAATANLDAVDADMAALGDAATEQPSAALAEEPADGLAEPGPPDVLAGEHELIGGSWLRQEDGSLVRAPQED